MSLSLLRGVCRVTAAVTGLLLVYGVTYAMEGMTTRISMVPLHELTITTLGMLPWMWLYCSGVDDFGTVTRQAWVFWVGVSLAVALLYYFERNTSSSFLTKVAMPLLATAVGLLPHVVRRIRFVFTVFSLAAGIAGLVVFYFVLALLLSPSVSSFATWGVGFVVVAFGTASLATGVLMVASLWRRHAQMT